MEEIIERINKCRIIPVIKINNPKKAVDLADALLKGGIDVMEITFRTEAAREAIALVSEKRPEILVGAGTVLNKEGLFSAMGAGAKFAVSPGLSQETVSAAKYAEFPFFPGVATPSEIMQGLSGNPYSASVNVFKFFPAENFGGIKTLEALAAPFGNVKFIATGGINRDNAAEYLKSERVLAVGGSWMVQEKLIEEENWGEITRLTKEAIIN
jgi:2-dehydro-3-deoxyphosphogluconate aldolase/(4S)-4-hydroxy-2-oxoglutarate aldolase